jgi:predicted nucleotidyltransferase
MLRSTDGQAGNPCKAARKRTGAKGARRPPCSVVWLARARGDARLGSDIDIMIEFSPEARVTVFNYAGLKDFVASLFDSPVDVVNRDALKPYVRPVATTDAVYAF